MTIRTNSRLAGFMFLFYIATGIAGMRVFAPATSGATTAEKLASIVHHAMLMRASAAYAILMMMNALVLGIALYGLTRTYDRELAMLALLCRVMEAMTAPVGALATRALLVTATHATTTSGGEAVAASAIGGVLLEIRGFSTLVSATAFAIGSTIFCYLFLRARTIPRSLAWSGLLSSILLVIALPLQMAAVIGAPVTLMVWIPIAVFEVVFALWLLIKGVEDLDGHRDHRSAT